MVKRPFSKWGLALLCLAVLVTGCARQNILEDLGLVLAVGYDLADDGKLVLTVTMPEISREAQEKVQVITSKGDLSKEARENIAMSTDRQIVNGQLRTVVFSEKLARKGVWKTLDTILRDVNITSNVVVAITDGETRELLHTRFPDRPRIGRYLFELLRKEAKSFTVPRTNVHDFARLYYTRGADPYAPYVQLKNGAVRAAGTALFHRDRFVGSLSPEETKMLLLLQGKGQGGDIKHSFDTHNGKKEMVMLTFVRTNPKREIIVRPGKPVLVRYQVQVGGQVVEYTGDLDLTREKNKKIVEKSIEEGLSNRIIDLFEQLQHQYKSDPLGIGEAIRATGGYRPWTEEKWRDLYQNAEIEVKFDLRLVRTGMTK
ncbi:Ger(x)C family spore germination protein [Tumebacillus sp. DT12]|uniref:Ger(X)C family spore germination protein n=1 Tax=Tumebacillus lacus TaxID=2995335 RepID=A0ABT3X0S5_9BACL|nr:Ger(x)C family spore germination protein [Tumebacillus lacus]MCX7569573.1 Ger(x)C family spore germination protein [Tumebacillus lacus]